MNTKYILSILISIIPIVFFMIINSWFKSHSYILAIAIIISHFILFGVSSIMLTKWIFSPEHLDGNKFFKLQIKSIGVGILCNLPTFFIIFAGRLFNTVDVNDFYLIIFHSISAFIWIISNLHQYGFKIKISN